MEMRVYWFIAAVLSICLCQPVVSETAGLLSVTGQVVDYLARPVAGAEVTMYEQKRQERDYTAELIAPIVTTDADGRFALQAEVTSQWSTFIVARKPGLAPGWDGLNYGGNTLGKGRFLLVLEKPRTLTGVVVDKEGHPVRGAAVQAVPKTSYMYRLHQRPIYGPPEWFTTTTNDDGVFRFDTFAADVSADFWVWAPQRACTYTFTTHLQDCCGYDVGRENIRLVLPQESPVRGCVMNAKTDQPVPGIELRLSADREREDISNRYRSLTVVTDPSGTFVFPGVPAGRNKIALAAADDGTCPWVGAAVTVDVVPGQPSDNVLVSVEQGQIIECVVRDKATGRPLSGMRASAHTEDYSVGGESVTDEKGVAQVRVPAGQYRVSAGGEAYKYWQVSTPVTVADGQPAHVEVLLDKEPSIEGTVLGSDGRPAEDVLVTVHPFGDHAYTDRNGHFRAGYEERRADDGLCLIARDRAHSLVGVTNTKALDAPIQLTLEPGLIARGRITDSNGIGIPAARVMLCVHLRSCLSRIGEEVLADSNGSFECRGLPRPQEPFDYRISVHAAGYAPRTYEEISFDGEPGSTVDLEPIQLGPTNLSVSGMVVDANDVPVPRMIVLFSGRQGTDQPERNTATDEQGRFAITRIGAGPIQLRAGFSNGPRGSGVVKARAGDHNVKIVLGQTRVHEGHESLLGAALPDVSELGVNPNDANAEGKAVLVCFFDMQQRPSRHAISQLGKKAEMLDDKGIRAIVVDVSGVDKDERDRWIADRKVPYPVGGIGEDFDEKKLQWGVRSLPWLILTDKAHRVVSEGFDLSDLDKELEGMGEHR